MTTPQTPPTALPVRSLEPTGAEVPSTVPTHWYNLAADLPEPVPPHLHPGTREPLTPDDLAPLFPLALVQQEVTTERYVEIPQTIREIYALWRPSPLVRARRLERALGTPARIYYKYEGVSPVGSHKPNTAVAQAYYNALEGTTRLTTETGAGQWGASLSFAGALLGLDVEVWQVRASYDSKPYRRAQMEVYGGICHPSPSDLTEAGRAMLAADPETTGSLGMAISEAVETAAKDPAAHYALGSVLNHVMLHQSVIGQEALVQLDEAGEGAPDVVFGCAGGGSNLAGLTFPFLGRNLREGTTTRLVACEPAACPSLTQGEYRYDFGDVAGLTPLLKMHTLGKDFVPPAIHAGGLRYHGMSPMVSHAVHLGLMDAVAVDQDEAFTAGTLFARSEGIIPAPESTHAVAAAVAHARAATEPEVIVLGLSGNGVLDLPAYAAYV
ncbi:tryptophan synthase beta chain [Cellulosimicrobium aquatile]|jgi:tryptophan synthase beta chain|uniref:Tryptophan synthase beta chain n=2 Tax=Cellulosimicrobium TaxID=157920 RepID=A0A4Y8QX96_9MICO|nr:MULTISPECIES: TrpB-like pyridoxal phosphate-dependent enzyme [Cellulosimicrobium]TGA67586.1 TrpB-like pyridoxal phosphate-dependent enzyme [Cellulosimicrobium terreum]MCM3534682.1 TrpB-like pyridoxal phosphate-dependent enzyme [Cellulosimicrobium funkei]MDQ8040566.1 TrpB-like pyridoxal phosphate-dependent enzyme [Cellulosimicrobium sp. XJ-DQ-B-000]NMF30056.1 TrpB-like pyridoxal phosphate-dependent enzyme [Cellulosimicrobium aquatile]TFF04160.1 TrpB-like pyridoxal phosphate-dependent enzyme 